MPGKKQDRKVFEMKKIENDILGLRSSPFYRYRNENKYKAVIGDGDLSAEIMFIGEAPGKREAETGVPFCGTAGRVLDGLLSHIGLKREKVYVTNIVKDRPPKNRDPLSGEIELYAPFLDRQIDLINPKVIATLGRHSMRYIMERFGLKEDIGPISKLHGRYFDMNSGSNCVKLMVLYHPCVAVYNRKNKKILERDFEVLDKLLRTIKIKDNGRQK